MAGRWMCAGGTEPVRVVHGDGQVLSPMPPVRVADILDGHPHHYICHMSPELPSNKSPMLPLDYELEPGYVYFLLPLPRLFPTSASGRPSCCCRFSNHDRSLAEGHMTPRSLLSFQKAAFSPLNLKAFKQLVDKIGSPMRSIKKISPELSRSPSYTINSRLSSPLLSPTYGLLKHSKRGGNTSPGRRCVSPKSSPNRLRENANARMRDQSNDRGGGRCTLMESLCTKWKPGLGCISETDSLVTACEELRLCLDRRRLTFDARVRPGSPGRMSDPSRTPPRERLSLRFEKEDNDDQPVKQHVPLSSFVFV